MKRKVISKPENRSRMRLFLGKAYFSLKRYMSWFLGGLKFAHKGETELPFLCFSHETPLLRKLKDVDMYLQYNKITNLKIAIPRVNDVSSFPA